MTDVRIILNLTVLAVDSGLTLAAMEGADFRRGLLIPRKAPLEMQERDRSRIRKNSDRRRDRIGRNQGGTSEQRERWPTN